MPRVVAKKSERMSPEGALLADLREMIIGARAQVARAADSTLVMLYWHMGRRIRVDILKRKRAAYGEEIVATLSQQLTAEFVMGDAFTSVTLRPGPAGAGGNHRATRRRGRVTVNAIRAIHPYRHEALWVLAEIGIQWSAVRCQRRHPEARRAEKRLPGVLPPRSLLAPGWPTLDDGWHPGPART
jgi:hypothetical protein